MAYGYEYLGPANIKKQPPPKRDDTLGPAFYSPKKRKSSLTSGHLGHWVVLPKAGLAMWLEPLRYSSSNFHNFEVNLLKYNERRRRCQVVKEIRSGLKLALANGH